MSEANRYLDLLNELNTEEEPTEESESKEPKKAKAKAKSRKKKPPTARVKSDPKMPRVNKSSVAKSKSPDFEKGTYYLPKTTTHKMRIHAATDQIEMSDLVNNAVLEYLKNKASEGI